MARSIPAIPNPDMVVWARKSSGMALEIAAQKMGIDAARLADWESGEQQPTLAQLRKLSNVYKRHITAFFMPQPPPLPSKLKDLRLFPETSPEIDWFLTMEARTARERRAVVLELYEIQGEVPPEFTNTTDLRQDPEAIGQVVRGILGIEMDEQTELSTPDEVFKFWRTRVEESGVLVFQSTKLDPTTARGFSIPEFPLPIIVVNRKDSQRARIFTLLHEFTHILLLIGGVCDLDYREGRAPADQKIEVFCNHVAGAALVPRKVLRTLPLVVNKEEGATWSESEVEELAGIFGVSREVIVRRLLILGYVTSVFYERQRNKYIAEHKKFQEKQKERGGFLPPAGNIVSAAGRKYVSAVLNALYSDRITRRDVSAYLGVRLKHLPKIETLVGLA